MFCDRLPEVRVALLMEIAPDEGDGQVSLRSSSRQFGPHVVAKLLLVQRQGVQSVDIPLFKSAEDGPREAFSGAVRISEG